MNKRIGFSLARLWVSVMLTLLPLIACSPDSSEPQASADFSLSVAKSVSAVQGTEVQTDISITRSNGFGDAVTLSVNDLPAGVTQTFTPNPSSGDTATLNLTVASSVAPGDYTMTLAGSAGGIEKTAPLALTVTATLPSPTPPSPTPTSPIINAVTIQDNDGSNQVRQNAGAIILDVTGEKLNGISSATLGSLSGAVVSNTDSTASLTFTIPNGADLGEQTLSLTTGFGTAEKTEAVVITEITVSNAGDDTAGKGTPDKPFKTMRFAVGQAGSGDTVRLLDGTYNEASGETFPVTFANGLTVTLEGESETGTIIEGSSVFDCLVITNSDVTISTILIKGCDFGINADDTAVVTISNTTLSENSIGLELDDTAQVTIENSTIEKSDLVGVNAREDSRLEIFSSAISGNGTANNPNDGSGLDAEQTAAGVLHLENVRLENNFEAGLELDTEGTVEVFNSAITNNLQHGVRVNDLALVINLGDAKRAGKNTIEGNRLFQLNDQRPATPVVIKAFGNTIGGGGKALSDVQEGPDDDGNSWQIITAGNQIDFGP